MAPTPRSQHPAIGRSAILGTSPAVRTFKASFVSILAALAMAIGGPAAVQAQAWPSRPITLVVAFTPGAASDYTARIIAQGLSEVLGQPVVVESKPGGGGAIASTAVAKALPDGYTLLITTIGPAVLRPLIDHQLSYDAVADFTPIVLVGDTPNVLVTGPTTNFGSVQEVVAFAKQNPGRLTIAHPGVGTMGHLTALLFAAEAGIGANFVAYRGSSAILSDLVGGHIDLGSIAYSSGTSAARILAVTTEERLPLLPSIPTMRECNLPDVIGSTWHGIFAPAGLAADVASRLNAAANAFLDKAETRQRLGAIGYRVFGGPPERLRDRMSADRAKWSAVIRAAKIAIDP
jgi:tripartite-type tricarboxylate transporter receptor subunit TctC